MQQTCACRLVLIDESWSSLKRSRNRNHTEFHLGELVYFWRVLNGQERSGPRWNENWFGAARVLAHHPRVDGPIDRNVWCVHNTLYRAAPEHLRPATARETFIHDTNSGTLLPSQLEQVLQQGHVFDGAWTDLHDQDGPPSGAMERLGGNDLDDEGPEGQHPSQRMRHRQTSNLANTQFTLNKTRMRSRFQMGKRS